MHEKLVIVPRVKTTGEKILNIGLFALTCLMFVLAIAVPQIYILPAICLAVLWFFLMFQSNTEFEYTYYDGELRFAKIKGKRKRKDLGEVQMEDVLAFAPRGDRSVYKYENDRNISYKNLTSRRADAKVYELVFKAEKGICRYEFEPDEEMLDAIIVKYPRSVIK